MMVKSGLESFILKFTEPLQRYLLTRPIQPFWTDFFLHWAAVTLKGLGEFQNKKSRPLFTIIFKTKISVSRLEILVHLLKEF